MAGREQEQRKEPRVQIDQEMIPKKRPCAYCAKLSHLIRDCENFKKLSVTDRRAKAAEKRLCWNCLGVNHAASKCLSKVRCAVCKLRHHQLLHEERKEENKQIEQTRIEHAHCTTGEKGFYLGTIALRIKDKFGNLIKVRALLDQGSTTSVITEKLAIRLRLNLEDKLGMVGGLGNVQTLINKQVNGIMFPHFSLNPEVKANLGVVPTITSYRKSLEIKDVPNKWKGLMLAEVKGNKSEIDILLGQDVYSVIAKERIIRSEPTGSAMIALETGFGWVLMGAAGVNCPETKVCHMLHELPELHELMCEAWEARKEEEEMKDENNEVCLLTEEGSEVDQWMKKIYGEEIQIEPNKKESELAVDHFKKYTRRKEDGRFVCRLPFNERISELKETRRRVVGRFLGIYMRNIET